MEFIRGSEWRRWEMHLHTPQTMKEDRYTGNSPNEKWDGFYRSIQEYVGDGSDPLRAICAVAITDYLSISNYLKVKHDNCLPNCVKLVMPNVELRMLPLAAGSPINIHCIFSPAIESEIDNRFFAQLEFEYNHTRYNATKSGLMSLGRSYHGSKNLTDEEAHRMGLTQYVVTPETISNLFKNDPELRNNTIIAVSNKSKDGASGIKAHSDYFEGNVSQLDAKRQSIYQLADMLYSASPKDISYFLGQHCDDKETVFRKCGKLMPCIHGCDAHSNARIFSPENNRFCWIKADPTFEGLKQVIYEPAERVRINPTIPDDKHDYHIIDRVEIAGNENFSPDPIYFSDKLTCIIGGKSTGKSLLLHNMALALDEKQVNAKQKTAGTNVKKVPELRVYWHDGICSDDADVQRKIVYIPQTYLNRLSDEKEETTEIDTIIQEIVLQNEQADQSYRALDRKISSHKQLVAKTILDFCQTVERQKGFIDAGKEIGDRNGIDSEIKKISFALEQLSREYDVTEAEVRAFQLSAEKIQRIPDEIASLRNEQQLIESMKSVVEIRHDNESSISVFSDMFRKAIESAKKAADEKWETEKSAIINQIVVKIQKADEELKQNEKTHSELKPKMEGNEQIGKLSEELIAEKEKLAKIEKIDGELLLLKNTYDAQLEVLCNSFESYKDFYTEYVEGINTSFTTPLEDLLFSANCVLRNEQFMQKMNDIINQKTKNRFSCFKIDAISETDLSPTNLKALIESLLSESLQLKKDYGFESALREILADWFNIDYVVKMDDDSIEDMSPGKKALVLLKLLISLAESRCPILIDQPEDDLDNRSIFDELIQFIKAKKVDRQIITVTHNANIVLGGDAELVIVANQDGKSVRNKEHRFEYRGGSIESNLPVADTKGILNEKGIQEHICEILEGGKQAFDLRRSKYHFVKR